MVAAIFANQQGFFSIKKADYEVATSLGTKSHLILPDGTKVWLNAASKLHYDKKFNGDLREVRLEGEAFFDVKKDKTRPFIVHTSDIEIRVLGTAFNVKSYKEEATIETTLIHGSVQVTSNGTTVPTLILKPNEKLVITKESVQNATPAVTKSDKNIEKKKPLYFISRLLPVEDSSFVETSWIENRLLFEGDTFSELAVKMERWFNVKIEFKSAEVSNNRLRGVFEDETIDEALKALQQIANFKYAIKDNNVTISK